MTSILNAFSKTRRLALACTALGLSVFGCNSADFGGTPGSKQAPQTQDAAKVSPSPDNVVIPGDCGDNGATQATLMTPQVQNGVAGNYIEYTISVTDCAGRPKEIAADSILFDIDATSASAGKGIKLPYAITAGSGNFAGKLDEIAGSDLFGNVGTYYHYKTDQTVNLDGGSNSGTATLRIELQGEFMASPQAPADATSAQVTLASFLRFGKAAPIQKDVVFVGVMPADLAARMQQAASPAPVTSPVPSPSPH